MTRPCVRIPAVGNVRSHGALAVAGYKNDETRRILRANREYVAVIHRLVFFFFFFIGRVRYFTLGSELEAAE